MNSNKRIKFSFIMALLAFMLPIQNEAATIQKGCFGTITLYVDEEKTVSSAFDSFAESNANDVRWSSTEEFWISDTNYRNNNYFYTIKSENIYSHTCVLVGRLPTTEPQKVYCHLNYGKGTRYIGYYNVEVVSLGKLSVEQRKEGNVVYLSCPLAPNANLYYFIGDYDFLLTVRYDGWVDVDYYDYNTHIVKNAIPYTSSGITLPSGEEEIEITGFASYPKYEPGYNTHIYKSMVVVAEINAANFPDSNFRSYLLGQSYGSDAVITDSEISSITSINVSGTIDSPGNITSLKGIEYFTALKYLNCSYNQLISLDVSRNTALTYLFCGSNQLTSLDVSKNTALTRLSCGFNQLTSLDISKNTALEELKCGHCQLDVLDVSKNTALTYLACHGNNLLSIDVSKNTALNTLYCYRNKISGANMDDLISSLPQNETEKVYGFYVIDNSESDEENVCTKPQVAAVNAKGWIPYYKNVPEDKWLEFEGSEDVVPALKGDVNGDGEVTGTDLVALTNMILGKTEKKASADLNGDGDVSGTDYVMLVNIVLGKKQ